MAPRTLTQVLAAAVVVVGAAGCGSSTDEGGTTADSAPPSTSAPASPSEPTTPDESEEGTNAEPAVITIKDFEFTGPATVAPGATVMVVNEDTASHTATSDAGDFDEVVVEGGAEGTFTAPSEPGEYPYVCDFHPDMTATLVVE